MRDHIAETGVGRYDPDHDAALQHALRRERHRRDVAECAREADHQARQTTDAAHRRLADAAARRRRSAHLGGPVPAMTSSGAGSRPVRVRVFAVLVHDGRVCLIRRRRPAGDQLSFPGGVAEDDEDPTEVLRRELLE
ncbi:NUDIX domain-containing protein [Kitasatospora sp. NPDC059599]|uniref:NUDIX domain-containing protein n=1 Tax=Kitasatospora sp. NPDC059599 TaxID=3346880 RepID=UPI00367F82C9